MFANFFPVGKHTFLHNRCHSMDLRRPWKYVCQLPPPKGGVAQSGPAPGELAHRPTPESPPRGEGVRKRDTTNRTMNQARAVAVTRGVCAPRLAWEGCRPLARLVR